MDQGLASRVRRYAPELDGRGSRTELAQLFYLAMRRQEGTSIEVVRQSDGFHPFTHSGFDHRRPLRQPFADAAEMIVLRCSSIVRAHSCSDFQVPA